MSRSEPSDDGSEARSMAGQQEVWRTQRLRTLQERGVDLDQLRARLRLTPEECLSGLETFVEEMTALRQELEASRQH